MKRYILLILTLSLCLSGCRKEKGVSLDITGIWHIEDIGQLTRAASIGNQEIDVYVEFTSGGTFCLYQMLGAGSFRSYAGTWTLAGTTLNGVYSDGTAWGSSYDVTVDGNTMTMTSKGEVYTYSRADRLPDGIR